MPLLAPSLRGARPRARGGCRSAPHRSLSLAVIMGWWRTGSSAASASRAEQDRGPGDPLTPATRPMPIEFGTTAWYVLMVLAGLAVGVAVAIARTVFTKDD